MKKVPLASALLFAIVLIAGSLWNRFGHTRYESAGLFASNTASIKNVDPVTEEDFTTPIATSTGSKAAQPLTPTDTISRQLFSDYISLKSRGTVDQGSLIQLAAKYQNQISLSIDTPRVEVNRIIVSSNSSNDYRAYYKALNALRNKYGAIISSSFSKGDFSNPDSPDFQALMKSASKLYAQAVEELYATPVPKALVNSHAQYISLYLSTEEALKILSNSNEDPLRMLGALNTFAKNSKDEEGLLSQIQVATLKSIGDIDPNSI